MANIKYPKEYNSNSRLYKCWEDMHRRCAKNHYYKDITVCKEWLDYKNFMDWSLQNGYEDSLTIDRIDNKSNYKPNNCRWVGRLEQARNRNYTKIVTKSNKSGARGVFWSNNKNRWIVRVKNKDIGRFKELKDACIFKNDYIDKINLDISKIPMSFIDSL